jgi:hypothetical protein
MTILSLNKFEKILSNNGMEITKIYIINDLCVYIEILIKNDATLFIIYVPSKYEISPGNNMIKKIKYIEINNEDGTIPYEYTSNKDSEIEKKYQEIVIDDDEDNIENNLEQNYNFPINLEDINKNDIFEIKDIFRQLRRLKFCVEKIKYKITIFYKNYMCCIKRDNTYEFYVIEQMEINNTHKKLVVSTDLEHFYIKMGMLNTDINVVYKSISHILDRNQDKYVYKIKKIVDYKNNFDILSDNIIKKKNKYKNFLENFDILLKQLLLEEKSILEYITNIKNNNKNSKTLYNDIEYSHIYLQKEKELSKIYNLKEEIINNIINVKNLLENLSLQFDQICFDNTVMMDTILHNFEKFFLKND